MRDIDYMSKRLEELVQVYLIKNGQGDAMASLASMTGKSEETIRRWIRDGFPNATGRYKLALACGCSEEEALEIAKECLPKAAG